MEEKKKSQIDGWCNRVDSRHTLMSAPTLSRDSAASGFLLAALLRTYGQNDRNLEYFQDMRLLTWR